VKKQKRTVGAFFVFFSAPQKEIRLVPRRVRVAMSRVARRPNAREK
jgi:hypothetical protein